MAITGGCLCGAVRYEIAGSFIGAGNCHCPICRRSQGTAFVTWGFVRPEEFRWTAGSQRLAGYESSPGNQRCFCRDCGSPLAFVSGGDVVEVALASVDGDPGVRPREHVFVSAKAEWHTITDDLPQFAELPPQPGA